MACNARLAAAPAMTRATTALPGSVLALSPRATRALQLGHGVGYPTNGRAPDRGGRDARDRRKRPRCPTLPTNIGGARH
eukprot:11154663-Lingulodinium_polyedra.AAC.1